jgi:activating signal cointegrator 1
MDAKYDYIRVLSLHQPWAACMAAGLKKIETRSWGTKYRGLVAIHAARKWDASLARATSAFPIPVKEVLNHRWWMPGFGWEFPLGRIVALADLVDCIPTSPPTSKLRALINETEYALGNFEPDRWAWVFEDVDPVTPSIPYVGGQGLRRLSASPQFVSDLLKGRHSDDALRRDKQ